MRKALRLAIMAGGGPCLACAPEGTRTPNLLIRSQMLYPLSYGRMSSVFSFAEAGILLSPDLLDDDSSMSPERPFVLVARPRMAGQ
jgi:hypothetical protein